MISDIHTPIDTFLAGRSIETIRTVDHAKADMHVKAGIVPFMLTGAGIRYYVMKPMARHRNLTAPQLQLGKGTRMQYQPNKGWRDISEPGSSKYKAETLIQTGLREGMEELGVRLSNIKQLYDVGPYDFTSVASGKLKQMWLFAADMISESDFLPSNEIEASTAERSWVTLSEFAVAGRTDQRYILDDIEKHLRRHYSL